MAPISNEIAEKAYHLFGVPSSAGSFYSGTEAASQAYRDASVIEQLRVAGCSIVDEGEIDIPDYLPRHNTPPVRNWPAPRIVWEKTAQHCIPLLREGRRLLLLGGDCSIVVGSAYALTEVYGQQVHIIAIDGHIDAVPPRAVTCVGAAAMGLWFTTHASPFWHDPVLTPEQATVLGWSDPNNAGNTGIISCPLAEVRRKGPIAAAQQALQAIDANASILLHFDVDVFDAQEMPAAYSPNPNGFSWAEGETMLQTLLADPRVRTVEITEYSFVRDENLIHARRIVDLLARTLNKREQYPST